MKQKTEHGLDYIVAMIVCSPVLRCRSITYQLLLTVLPDVVYFIDAMCFVLQRHKLYTNCILFGKHSVLQ